MEWKNESAHGARATPRPPITRLAINKPRLDSRPGVSVRMPTSLHHTLVALLVLAGCKPPPHAAVTRCTDVFLSTKDAQDCTVSVERFIDESSLATISTQSRNLNVHVTLHLALAKGEVQVNVKGSPGVVATSKLAPGAPITLELDVPLNRNSRSFSLELVPLSGNPAGLSGTLSHHAI